MDEFLKGEEGLDQVLLRLAERWGTLDFETQRYIATQAAGSRQQSRFLALMSNYQRTTELVGYAYDSAGSGQERFAKTMESLDAKITKLKNAWQEFLMGLANQDLIKGVVDVLTKFLETVNKLIDGLSGGNGLIKSLLSIGTVVAAFKGGGAIFNKLFDSKQITEAVAKLFGREIPKAAEGAAGAAKEAGKKISTGLFSGLRDNFKANKNLGKDFFESIWSFNIPQDKLRASLVNYNDEIDSIFDVYSKTSSCASTHGHDYFNEIDTIKKEIERAIRNSDGDFSGLQNAYGVSDEIIEKITQKYNSLATEEEKAQAETLKMESRIEAVSIAATGLGVALLGVSKIMKNNGNAKWADGLQRVGSALTTIGAVLPVVIAGMKAFGVASKAALGWVSGVITAITLVGYAIKWISDANYAKSIEGQLEAAAKSTEKLKTAAEEAQSAYDDLLSGKENYDSLVNTLENLTEGTNAWKEALLEVNSAVLELIQNYPELSDYIDRGESGALTIDAKGWEEAIANQMKAVQAAEANLIASKMYTSQLELDKKAEDIDTRTTTEISSVYSKRMTSRQYSLINGDYSELLDQYEQALIDNTDMNKILTTAKNIYNFDKDKLNADLKEREDYKLAIVETAQLRKSQGAAMINSLLSTETLNNEFSDEAVDFVSDYFSSEAYQQAIEEARSEWQQDSDTTEEAIREKYASLMNIDVKDIDATLTIDDLTNAIANLTVANDAATWVTNLASQIKSLSEVDNNGQLNADVFAGILSGDYNFTNQEYNVSSIQGNTLDEIINTLFSMNVDDFAGTLGMDAVRFRELWEARLAEFAQTKENENQRLTNIFGADAVSETSSLDMAAKENLLANAASLGQKDAQKYLDAFMNVVTDEDNTVDATLANTLSTYDPSSLNEMIAARQELLSQGYDENTVAEFWTIATTAAKAYASTIEEINSITTSFETDLDSLPKIEERLTNGEATQEDLDLLKQYGIEVDNLYKTSASTFGTTVDAAKDAADKASAAIAQQFEDYIIAEETAIKRAQILWEQYGLDKYSTDGVTADNINNIANILGMVNTERLADDQWLNAVSEEYTKIQQLINQGDEIQNQLNEEGTYLEGAGIRDIDQARISKASSDVQMAAGYAEAQDAGLDISNLQAYADQIEQVTELSREMALSVAIDNTLMNKGLSEIIDSYDDWMALIDDSTGLIKTAGAEDIETFNNLKKSVNKMLNTSEDLSDAFWNNADNMKNLQKAAEGDTAALANLQKAAAQDYLQNIDLSQLNGDITTATTAIQDFSNYLSTVDLPELEAGIQWNDSAAKDFISSFNNMARAANLTSTQIQAAVQNMGFDAEIEYVDETRSIPNIVTETDYQNNDDGMLLWSRSRTYQDGVTEVTGSFPVVRTLTSTGTGGGGVSVSNVNAGKGNKSTSSSGGGGSSESTDNYKASYDKQYNLQEKINEALRRREQLEKNYDKLLKNRSTTFDDLYKNQTAQLSSLEEEIELQKQLQAARRSEIESLKYESYTTDDTTKSFKNWGASKYITYDFETGLRTLNDSVFSVTDDNLGSAIDEYISKFEELTDSYEETVDTIQELEEAVQDIREQGMNDYLDFEQRLYDAITDREQKVIDEYQALSDTLADSNSDLLDALQESIDLERQIRDNTEKEEDIADMEARLAYLRRDTSGANATEILKLEEELQNAQQDYTDTLIDQSIEKLSEQNDKAQEAREHQIELMQAQLDYDKENGAYWTEVGSLISTALASGGSESLPVEMIGLLEETEGFIGLSEFGKMNWLKEMYSAILAASSGYSNWKMYDAENSNEIEFSSGEKATYNNGVWEGTGGVQYTGVNYNPTTQKYEYEDKTTELQRILKAVDSMGDMSYGSTGSDVALLEEWLCKLNYMDPNAEHSKDSFYGTATESAVHRFQLDSNRTVGYNLSGTGTVGSWTRKALKKYIEDYYGNRVFETGGLANFTGPAWLDGTRSSPELVLNARDTQNFLALKDTLAALVSKGSSSGLQNSGDNYYEIHINVDELSNDYDVDKLADKIKQEIARDASYRNVNAINYLR